MMIMIIRITDSLLRSKDSMSEESLNIEISPGSSAQIIILSFKSAKSE